ncbi:MAG: hypothetical protein KAG53_11320 [Endozoicomonadaceae bacterium]|nr:hypothetical protein [Endozoicomonadaceae bacterium]
MTTTYDLIFSGDIDETLDKALVQKNIASLLKASPRQIDNLFSGKTITLKSGLEEITAKKYLAVLKKTGIRCWLKPYQPKSTTTIPTKQAEQAEQTEQTEPEAQSENASEPRTKPANKFFDANRSNLTIAPVGADVQDKKPEKHYKVPNTSHLSLRPPSGYLVDPPTSNDNTPFIPDISHLSLDPLQQ